MKYGPRTWNEYDIAIPQQPLLILVHGGSFIGGGIDAKNLIGWENFAEKHHIIVANIDYRLATADKPSFPSVIWDIKLAYNHLIKKYNPSSVTILGTSAGANVALNSIIHYKIPAKFIGFYGLYDLTRKDDFSPTVNNTISTYIGTGKYIRRHASPYFKKLPNIKGLLVHGSRDTVVDINQSEQMAIKTGWRLYYRAKNHAFNIFDHSDLISKFVNP